MDHFNGYTVPNNNITQKKHHIVMRNRESMDLTGVIRIDSLNDIEFVLQTILGYVTIRGRDLEMKNVNIDKGELSISGYVSSIEYFDDIEDDKSNTTKSFFSKLFR